MPNEESGTVETVETPKAGEKTQVLDDEELTRIVGGADPPPVFWGVSGEPDWGSDG